MAEASKKLVEWLEKVGHEVCDQPTTDDTGTIVSVTNDEALARLMWQQALGYVQTVVNHDGSEQHRIYPPDRQAQQFIIERREGKQVVMDDKDKGITATDRIIDLVKDKLNLLADQSVTDELPMVKVDDPSGG